MGLLSPHRPREFEHVARRERHGREFFVRLNLDALKHHGSPVTGEQREG
jgi:hypothetical protein